MKWLPLLLVSLAACGPSRIQSFAAEYQTAERTLMVGDFPRALALEDAALRNCGSSLEWCWRWRIL